MKLGGKDLSFYPAQDGIHQCEWPLRAIVGSMSDENDEKNTAVLQETWLRDF